MRLAENVAWEFWTIHSSQVWFRHRVENLPNLRLFFLVNSSSAWPCQRARSWNLHLGNWPRVGLLLWFVLIYHLMLFIYLQKIDAKPSVRINYGVQNCSFKNFFCCIFLVAFFVFFCLTISSNFLWRLNQWHTPRHVDSMRWGETSLQHFAS